jgi:1,4-alpha-glucan branching enzyme
MRASEAVNYLESHDKQRVMRDLLASGFDEQRARAKSALGTALLFTMPGEPLLYHGQEWGEATPRWTNERNTLHWEETGGDGGKWLLNRYQQLAWLRRRHGALRSDGFSLDASYPDQKSLVYHRWDGTGDELVVAVNFSPALQTLSVPFPSRGRWSEVFDGGTLDLDVQGEYVAEMAPSSARVYVRS